jgi:hypothetical protein
VHLCPHLGNGTYFHQLVHFLYLIFCFLDVCLFFLNDLLLIPICYCKLMVGLKGQIGFLRSWNNLYMLGNQNMVGTQPCYILRILNSCKNTYSFWSWKRSMMLRSWRLWKPSKRKEKIMSYKNHTNLTKKKSLFKKEQSGDGHPCIHFWSDNLYKLVLNAMGAHPAGIVEHPCRNIKKEYCLLSLQKSVRT